MDVFANVIQLIFFFFCTLHFGVNNKATLLRFAGVWGSGRAYHVEAGRFPGEMFCFLMWGTPYTAMPLQLPVYHCSWSAVHRHPLQRKIKNTNALDL